MASKCNTCNGLISSSEFISCAGICQQLFHIKCAAVNKSMLNAVTSSPNIHWFCNECNSGNRNVAASMDRINESIGLLTKSLSGDLVQFVDGFKSLTENFMETISTAVISNATNMSSNASHDEKVPTSNDVSELSSELSTCNNTADESNCTTDFIVDRDRAPVRSVVVSNVGKDVSADCLTDYLVDELCVERERISVSLLLPTARSINDLNFLQYKITLPEEKYGAIVNPKSWPPNIRVRDFVHKVYRLGVSKQQFFAKKFL